MAPDQDGSALAAEVSLSATPGAERSLFRTAGSSRWAVRYPSVPWGRSTATARSAVSAAICLTLAWLLQELRPAHCRLAAISLNSVLANYRSNWGEPRPGPA